MILLKKRKTVIIPMMRVNVETVSAAAIDNVLIISRGYLLPTRIRRTYRPTLLSTTTTALPKNHNTSRDSTNSIPIYDKEGSNFVVMIQKE